MKRFFYFFVLFIFLLSSCNSNDSNNPVISDELELSSSTRFLIRRNVNEIPSFSYFDSIGIIHNEVLTNQMSSFTLPFASMNSLETNQLTDFYLQTCHNYLQSNYASYQQLTNDYSSITNISFDSDVRPLFDSDPLILNYVDSLNDISELPISSDVCLSLRELQSNFYNLCFTQDDGFLYLENQEEVVGMMVMLSVAANSAEYWYDASNLQVLNTTFGFPSTQGASISWWKADAIGALIGLLGGWWSSILWGAVSSIVAAIKENATKAKADGWIDLHVYQDTTAINNYNLYRLGESNNPYLIYCYE